MRKRGKGRKKRDMEGKWGGNRGKGRGKRDRRRELMSAWSIRERDRAGGEWR